jgi:hypothetical protein
VKRLIEHGQFEAAKEAAPQFTELALKTVAELEYQIERRRK